MRIQPHRSSQSVVWGPVQVLVDGVADASWDYLSTVQIKSSVALEEGFLGDTGLQSLEDLVGVIVIDCPSTGWRDWSRSRLSAASAAFTITIPPGAVARSLTISRAVVLATPTEGTGGTAVHVGDRLNEAERFRYDLEGSGERFPVEAVDFTQLGLSSRALWDLRFDPEGWDDLYAAVVRLRVNTQHPLCDALLRADHEDHRLATSVLRREIIMQVLQHMSRFEDDLGDHEFETDTVGGVLSTLCQTYLKMSLDVVLGRVRTDPADIGIRLQSSTGFLRRS